VDQNEIDADAAIAAVQADVDGNEADADTAIAANTTSIATTQADVDQNEIDADAAIAALQADVDGNESDIDFALVSVQNDIAVSIAALQADVDQNESDSDSADTTMQADIDQNESDADAAIAALQTDVDGNEADADAAIAALQANTAPGTIVGQMNYWNGTSWQTINPGNTGSVLQLVGTTPTWVLNPDIVAPVITLTGNATVTIELGAIYTDAGATATDLSVAACFFYWPQVGMQCGDITVTTSGTVGATTVGTYTITYSATDASGNVGTATRTVNVVDTTAPVITVTSGTDTVEQGSTWTDAGATAYGGETVTASGTVDTSTIGSYIITYNATDAAGNVGTATRTVNVVDTIAPVITVTSGTDTVERGNTWTDAGATADTGETVAASGTVDTSTIGSYIITYNATDTSDNVGTATRTVTVIDTTAPTFVLVAAADGTYKVGDNIDITVTYDEDVSVTGTPTLTLSNGAEFFDNFFAAAYNSGSGTTALVFRYTVTEGDTNSLDLSVSSYTGVITDGSGNTAGAASGDLGTVIVDANSPSFSSVAADDGTYKVGDNIEITVTYDEDVSVTGTPTLTLSNGATATYQSGTGTTALVFRYTVAEGDTNSSDLSVSSYTGGVITDGSGNTAGAASGYLGAVIVDANSPVITVTSGTDTVSSGSSWTDAGATADGGETVTASGTVDTSTIGSYIITYNATDASGNVGTATRTVTVGVVVGDSYQGGIIFWLDGNGGGLISAPTDQSSGAHWGCYGTNITGAGGTAIGTGNQNTIDIINANCTSSNGSPTAADICANLTLGGYSDWFLPSKDELNEMYLNKAAIGGFANFTYWSSTENDDGSAWGQGFYNGDQDGNLKDINYLVRAVRAF